MSSAPLSEEDHLYVKGGGLASHQATGEGMPCSKKRFFTGGCARATSGGGEGGSAFRSAKRGLGTCGIFFKEEKRRLYAAVRGKKGKGGGRRQFASRARGRKVRVYSDSLTTQRILKGEKDLCRARRGTGRTGTKREDTQEANGRAEVPTRKGGAAAPMPEGEEKILCARERGRKQSLNPPFSTKQKKLLPGKKGRWLLSRRGSSRRRTGFHARGTFAGDKKVLEKGSSLHSLRGGEEEYSLV